MLAAAPTAARLLRTRGADGLPEWSLFLECQEEQEGTPAGGYVRIWLGPRGHPSAVWRIGPDGALIDETAAAKSGRLADPRPDDRPARTLRSVLSASGWQVAVPLPSSALTPPGSVRLGLERMDASGRHSAWPRAMLPWQTEPGRAAIDTTAWDSLNR